MPSVSNFALGLIFVCLMSHIPSVPIPRARKIDSSGNYLPFIAYSVISFCEQNPILVELYSYLKSSPISKYVKLLNYETYHVTIYNIWDERDEFYPYQLRLGPLKREQGIMDDIMKPVLFEIAEKLKEFPDLTSIDVNEVKVDLRENGLTINFKISSMAQLSRIEQLREWCKEQYVKSDSRIFHIGFGYRYGKKELTEELKIEIRRLEEWVKFNISSLTIGKPTPVVFTSMEHFRPFHLDFQNVDKAKDLEHFWRYVHFVLCCLMIIAIIAFLWHRKMKVVVDKIHAK